MYNKSKINIHDDSIVVIPVIEDFDFEKIDLFISPMTDHRKRDWFDKDFYKCLPLSMANQSGFGIKMPIDMRVLWDGTDHKEGISFLFNENESFNPNIIEIESHFGKGIFTISLPFILKTPKNVNLFLTPSPNTLLPGLMPMSAIIETDNLRSRFTLNVKINIPNHVVFIPAETMLFSIIPIPRFFLERFKLVDAKKYLTNEELKSELTACEDHKKVRENLSDKNIPQDGTYFSGQDIYGNKFLSHQLPKKNKK